MKHTAVKFALFKVFCICLLLSNYSAFAQKTTIWIVRHAEKEAEPAADPILTTAGQKRAEELLKSLKHEKIAGIYVTKYKRTALTAQPTAQKYTLVPELYDPTDLKGLATKVLQFYKGHSVLIVGHSNTILPTITALGGEMPFSMLTDDDYDMLFKLTLKGGKAELEISRYGDPHHTTEIPDQYLNYTKEHFVKPPGRF